MRLIQLFEATEDGSCLYCLAVARALSKVYGAPIWGTFVVYEDGSSDLAHAYVRVGDMGVDFEGIFPLSEFADCRGPSDVSYKCVQRPVTAADIRQVREVEDVDDPSAMRWVKSRKDMYDEIFKERVVEQWIPPSPEEYAAGFEENSNIGDSDEFYWQYIPEFPLKMFLSPGIVDFGLTTIEAWKNFIETEIEHADDARSTLWSRLLHEPIEEPIVVAFTSDGKWDLWDGTHRVAASIATNRDTIPAVVGYPKDGKVLGEQFTTTTTDLPSYDDMMRDPEYFREKKKKQFEIIKVSPDEYIQRAVKGFQKEHKGIDIEQLIRSRMEGIIDKYASEMERGDVFPMVVLDYSGGDFEQEGLHRALAAKKLGIPEIPVMVVRDVDEGVPLREQSGISAIPWYHGTGSSRRLFVLPKGTHPSNIGLWFTNNKKVAEEFARRAVRMVDESPQMAEVRLDVNYPKYYNTYSDYLADWRRYEDSAKLRRALQRKGHDAIVISNSTTDVGTRRSDIAVFRKNQISLSDVESLNSEPIREKEGEDVLGIFEEEAFKDKRAMRYLSQYSVSCETEKHPDASGDKDDPKIWNIHYFKAPKVEKEKLIRAMQKGMYDGWYSLLLDDGRTYVIFNDGISILEEGFDAVSELASRHELSPEYMKHYLTRGISKLRDIFGVTEALLRENTCAPRAIAKVLGLPYDEVHQTCVKFKLWRPRRGMRSIDIKRAVERLGWTVKDRRDLYIITKRKRGTNVEFPGLATLNQVLKRLSPDEKYIISLKDHAIAYVDGKVYDESEYGNRHWVHTVYQIIPKEQVQEDVDFTMSLIDGRDTPVLVNPTQKEISEYIRELNQFYRRMYPETTSLALKGLLDPRGYLFIWDGTQEGSTETHHISVSMEIIKRYGNPSPQDFYSWWPAIDSDDEDAIAVFQSLADDGGFVPLIVIVEPETGRVISSWAALPGIENDPLWKRAFGSIPVISEAYNPNVRVKYFGGDKDVYRAYIGNKKVGHAQVYNFKDDRLSPDERYIWKSFVDPEYRRRGVATALYDAISKDLESKGLKLVPSPDQQLSYDAYKFWKARDPESIKRHRKYKAEPYQKYVGKQITMKGRPAVILRALDDKTFSYRYTDVPKGSVNSEGQGKFADIQGMLDEDARKPAITETKRGKAGRKKIYRLYMPRGGELGVLIGWRADWPEHKWVEFRGPPYSQWSGSQKSDFEKVHDMMEGWHTSVLHAGGITDILPSHSDYPAIRDAIEGASEMVSEIEEAGIAPASAARDGSDKITEQEQSEEQLPTLQQVKALAPQFAKAAQEVYDKWEQDTEGFDEEYGCGGICQDIAEAIADVAIFAGIDAGTVSAQVGEQHVWTLAKTQEGVVEIDIPPCVYEIGSCYTWKKIPDVVFDQRHIVFSIISGDPDEFEEMLGESRSSGLVEGASLGYWEDLSDEEKEQWKGRREKELKRLLTLNYPFRATWAGGGEEFTVLGPASWFPPYDKHPARASEEWKSAFQLMTVDDEGRRSIRMAGSLADAETGEPLLSRMPPTRKDPAEEFMKRVLGKSRVREKICIEARKNLLIRSMAEGYFDWKIPLEFQKEILDIDPSYLSFLQPSVIDPRIYSSGWESQRAQESIISESFLAEQTKCGIMNALAKYRPDLYDDAKKVPKNKIPDSIRFLQRHNLWDEKAESLQQEFLDKMRWYQNVEHQRNLKPQQQGEYRRARRAMDAALNDVMCHIVRLIRASSVEKRDI